MKLGEVGREQSSAEEKPCLPESRSEVSGVAYMPEVYNISMARMWVDPHRQNVRMKGSRSRYGRNAVTVTVRCA
ncbi:MAG: hypothetical protein RR954_07560 [Christensenellaceae bacterium]